MSPPELPGEFRWPVRVYYEDTDAGGVVYHAAYLRFMERARTEMLRARGWEQDRLADELGVLLVVRRVAVEYHRPARFNDALIVRTGIERLARASMVFRQCIERAETGEMLCGGTVQVACVAQADFRPGPIPEQLRESFLEC
ncbi:MAG: tol-pal system-associated acyl-CoA thioesterase [Halothiobacillaceae bacterium]